MALPRRLTVMLGELGDRPNDLLFAPLSGPRSPFEGRKGSLVKVRT